MAKEKYFVEGELSPEDVGLTIVEIRDWIGITQEGLAKEIGIKLATLKDIEEGRTAHGYNALSKAVAKYDLKCTIRVEQK